MPCGGTWYDLFYKIAYLFVLLLSEHIFLNFLDDITIVGSTNIIVTFLHYYSLG